MYTPGTKVRCVKHNGAHTGVVAVRIGTGYGIGWHGFISVPQTPEERKLMKALAEDGTTYTTTNDIEEVRS